MPVSAALAPNQDIVPFRVRYRAEAKGQVVHDSLHTRAGWTKSYLLQVDGCAAGFGSVAIGGPWKDKPTVFEFYLPTFWPGGLRWLELDDFNLEINRVAF